LPGLKWPNVTLNALARAIWIRGVDVEIVVSNLGSVPGGLAKTNLYANGWSCVDVASEIIKRIKKQFPEADDAALREKVGINLRVCFIRHAKKNTYADGMTIGNHSKCFIIDDMAAYIGSQNLYMSDLAEWGVIVDDASETKNMIKDFWKPLWNASFTGEDCDLQDVMDGLDIDRDGENINTLTLAGRQQAESAAAQSSHSGLNKSPADLYGTEGA
jgi:phosphatidylserine/phosphatidylglycerophosphate/cardiolipin synthase-like enzyme